MTGAAAYEKTIGCTALVADRSRWAVGRGCGPRIPYLHAPGGLKAGHAGMHLCALG